jgi:curved DNA-binding protein CbpA
MARVPFDPAADYYALLGVPPGAPPEEIQAAYRRLAKAFHPDLHAGSEMAAARMARVNVAKSVLLDPDTRAYYDQLRRDRRRPVMRPVVGHPPAPQPGPVRNAPPRSTRPRHRIVSNGGPRSASRGQLDRSTGILLLVAVPLIAALVLYVFEAVQLSIQPLRAAPSDVNLSQAPPVRPTARGAAEAAYTMVHAQPPSRELATRAYNFIMARSDSTPESELLRADALRLIRSAGAGDTALWEATVADVCHLAGRC